MSSYCQSEVTIPVQKYNALILRGRELQDGLKQCLEASTHYIERIQSIEAVLIPVETKIVDLIIPSVELPDINGQYLEKIWPKIKVFLVGVVVGGVVVLALLI